MTTQHTPGPWFANKSEMAAHSSKVSIRTKNDAYLICSDAGYQNAQLIADAPETKRQRDELLEALQAFVRAMPSEEGLGGHVPMVAFHTIAAKAREAIAKAGGAK